MKIRAGQKMADVLNSGIKITPMPLGYPGTIATKFNIKIAQKNHLDIIDPDIYPLVGNKNTSNIWEKIETLYAYYYDKLPK